jgi:hypothetical protein
MMRSTQQHDSWSFSPPSSRPSQRDSPERRRQQARGRASSGRPTSVGSARINFVSSNHHAAAEIARLQSIQAAALHRPSTPGLARQNSDQSTAANQSPTASASSEETSPPVAVGSGLATADRSISSIETRHNALSQAIWQDPFGSGQSQIDRNFYPPGRPNDFLRAVSFESRNTLSFHNNQYATGELINAQPGGLSPSGPFGYRHPR